METVGAIYVFFLALILILQIANLWLTCELHRESYDLTRRIVRNHESLEYRVMHELHAGAEDRSNALR